MRDLLKGLSELENRLEETYGVSLNEAMVLCSVGAETVTAGTIISCTGLTSSHPDVFHAYAERKSLSGEYQGAGGGSARMAGSVVF